MTAASLLEVRRLTVVYRRRQAAIRAVDGVSFDVRHGETVGLIGETGSGKTTIARAVLGLTPIQVGDVYFNGENITRLRFKDRRRIYRHMQIVFQDPYSSLNPSRTVGRTLAEPLLAYGEGDRTAVSNQVRRMLDRVHLPADTADRYPRELSGGQRQRVAIARALMPSPQLVICDEAVSALDLSVQAQILNLLAELQATSRLSYLFISHDLEVIRHLCQRVVVLYRGCVAETGTATELAESPAHPYTHALHQAVPLPNPRLQRQRRSAPAVHPAPPAAQHPAGGRDYCLFAPRCPHAADRCWNEQPALRSRGDQGEVACHFYPQWRRGDLPASGADARNAPSVRHRRPARTAPTVMRQARG